MTGYRLGQNGPEWAWRAVAATGAALVHLNASGHGEERDGILSLADGTVRGNWSTGESDGGIPTVAQYRAAFESGDTSWAKAVLECFDVERCRLNGNSLDLPISMRGGKEVHGRGAFQHSWELGAACSS